MAKYRLRVKADGSYTFTGRYSPKGQAAQTFVAEGRDVSTIKEGAEFVATAVSNLRPIQTTDDPRSQYVTMESS